MVSSQDAIPLKAGRAGHAFTGITREPGRSRTEEPDEGNPHVRICGKGAGQPVPLPKTFYSDFYNLDNDKKTQALVFLDKQKPL
jgi:hypothetical protein